MIDCSPAFLPSVDTTFNNKVIYKNFGANMNVARLLATLDIPLENLVRYHVWQQEQATRLLGHQTVKQGKAVGKFVCVFDAKGWHPGLFSRAAASFLRVGRSVHIHCFLLSPSKRQYNRSTSCAFQSWREESIIDALTS